MKALARVLIDHRLVLVIILINSVALFLEGFDDLYQAHGHTLWLIDYLCMIYFVLEIVIKFWLEGGRAFWKNGWNIFDFTIVALSTPVLLTPFMAVDEFSFFLLFRLGRLLRYLRLLEFIPDHDHIASGIYRALKASVGVFLVVILYNFILGLGSVYLFREVAPEYFSNPFMAIYSIFRVFTVEGWYEIPDKIAQSGTDVMATLARAYFVFTVFTGGILGMSLVNAVFVDQMTLDNLDETEELLGKLEEQLDARSSDMDQRFDNTDSRLDRLEQKIEAILERLPPKDG